MDPDSSHPMALGRVEGKVDMILSLLTAFTERTNRIEDRVANNTQRITALEAQVSARTDGSRFWIATLLSVAAGLIAAVSLAKEFFK
jgi:ABC-type Fe3+-hydroxamate transport system substrate-binding protein